MVVNRINGREISNLAEVARIIAEDGGIRTIALQGIGQDIVLDPAMRETANQRIRAAYRIPELQYIRAAP